MGQTILETDRLTLMPLRAEHTDAVVEFTSPCPAEGQQPH